MSSPLLRVFLFESASRQHKLRHPVLAHGEAIRCDLPNQLLQHSNWVKLQHSSPAAPDRPSLVQYDSLNGDAVKSTVGLRRQARYLGQ